MTNKQFLNKKRRHLSKVGYNQKQIAWYINEYLKILPRQDELDLELNLEKKESRFPNPSDTPERKYL